MLTVERMEEVASYFRDQRSSMEDRATSHRDNFLSTLISSSNHTAASSELSLSLPPLSSCGTARGRRTLQTMFHPVIHSASSSRAWSSESQYIAQPTHTPLSSHFAVVPLGPATATPALTAANRLAPSWLLPLPPPSHQATGFSQEGNQSHSPSLFHSQMASAVEPPKRAVRRAKPREAMKIATSSASTGPAVVMASAESQLQSQSYHQHDELSPRLLSVLSATGASAVAASSASSVRSLHTSHSSSSISSAMTSTGEQARVQPSLFSPMLPPALSPLSSPRMNLAHGNGHTATFHHSDSASTASVSTPFSPCSFGFLSPPTIGFIDTQGLLKGFERLKESPDLSHIDTAELPPVSPSCLSPRLGLKSSLSNIRSPNEDGRALLHISPSQSTRSANSSATNSLHSTPFSSRSSYQLSAPSSARSSLHSEYVNSGSSSGMHSGSMRRLSMGIETSVEDLTMNEAPSSPDITLPPFNTPIMTGMTGPSMAPLGSDIFTSPHQPTRPNTSAMALAATIAAPMVSCGDSASPMIYDQSPRSGSTYSPYLSPSSKARSLRSTVLASMQERTIAARLGTTIDFSTLIAESKEASHETLRRSSNRRKRQRDEGHHNLSDEDGDTASELPARSRAPKREAAETRLDSEEIARLPKCEHCHAAPVNPRYGTGRFCGAKCARTFSISKRYGKLVKPVKPPSKPRDRTRGSAKLRPSAEGVSRHENCSNNVSGTERAGEDQEGVLPISDEDISGLNQPREPGSINTDDSASVLQMLHNNRATAEAAAAVGEEKSDETMFATATP